MLKDSKESKVYLCGLGYYGMELSSDPILCKETLTQENIYALSAIMSFKEILELIISTEI